MKKLACIIGIVLVAIAVTANAEEASIAPFIGTWGGQWKDMTGRNKLTTVLVLWPNGNKTTLKLEGSVIRAETLVNGIPWNATFQKEK